MGKAKKIIIHQYCKGCALCVHLCPKKVLALSDNHNEYGNLYPEVHNLDVCIVCRLCEIHCPDFAIDIYAEEEE